MQSGAIPVTQLFDATGSRKYLNANERQAFYAAALEVDREVGLLCCTMLATGCRTSEALGLRPSHLDVGARALTFETLKQRGRGRYRQVPIPDSLFGELLAWSALTPGFNGRLWPIQRQTGWRWIKRVMLLAGVDGARGTARGLRHGFAVAAIQNGVALNLVQKWLGHSQISTTAIYTNAIGAEERDLAARTWAPFT